jgi:hypothetical protein
MGNALSAPRPFFPFEDTTLSFVDAQGFNDADLQVIAGLNSSVCQTISEHDVQTSLITREGFQAPAAIFEKGLPRCSIGSGDDLKSGSEPTITIDVGRDDNDGFDYENQVKERVSSPRVRRSSAARRKVKAKFECPIERCGGTFTRKKNLECEQCQTSPFSGNLLLFSKTISIRILESKNTFAIVGRPSTRRQLSSGIGFGAVS